ncbi:MAG: 1,4-alpha-glucan branching protein GlgB [Gemmataceae bacterium]
MPASSKPTPAPTLSKAAVPQPWLTAEDLYLFNQGSFLRAYDKLGAHFTTIDGVKGVHFAVWAPSAKYVAVLGSFNDWNPGTHPLARQGDSGIWVGFIPGVQQGQTYKYHIATQHDGYVVDKADPFGVFCEVPPKTASVVWSLDYEWHDTEYMATRKPRQEQNAPISIYELHLGSWMRTIGEGFRKSLSYRELAPRLVEHLKRLAFTHVELLPITEHPFFGSWGYQTTGYFAATSRYGTPQDLMYLIDLLHQNNIGVILDWVPSHFATDGHALSYFDGTHLYEHADPRQGYHPDWGSYVFNYGRHEVRSFLLSSALFWLDKYHIDGIRVDAVASMLYLDYSRKAGEWIPNQYGGRENIEAVEFLRRFNKEIYENYPGVQTYAEESTSWPMVSRPTYLGGLGFGYKWDMGWMHDTLKYIQREHVHRRHHHGELTFRMLYAMNENFVLPLSHDEVVHGKGPLFDKLSGDEWQKFAGLRGLYAYMYGMTGKKLLFMGAEIAQRQEWRHDGAIDWHLLENDYHRGVMQLVGDLNRLYANEPAMHELDNQPAGFEWIDCHDASSSVVCFQRKGSTNPLERIIGIVNFTPTVRDRYHVGLPGPGYWKEVLNTDASIYAGSNVGNNGGVHAEFIPQHGLPYSAFVRVPPLGAVFFKGLA